MNRPIYLTERQRKNTVSVAKYVAKKYGMEVEMAPRLAAHDGVFTNPKTGGKCVFKVVCRTIPSEKYSTYSVGSRKLDKLSELAADEHAAAMLIVSWTDRIGVHRINNPAQYLTEEGGRYDRNDPSDIERMAQIPITTSFKMLDSV